MYFTIFNDGVFQFLSLYRSLNKTTGLKLEHFQQAENAPTSCIIIIILWYTLLFENEKSK